MDRDVLEPFAASGATLRSIAKTLDISVTTVRYWLRKHELEALRRARRGPGIHGGQREVQLTCAVHGLTRHVLRPEGCYRCAICRSEAVTRRRRRIKALLVAEAGGHCALCGYDRCLAALQFHHVDPESKSFGLARRGVTRSLTAAREEAGKCILLCSNCHAEVEGGVVAPP